MKGFVKLNQTVGPMLLQAQGSCHSFPGHRPRSSHPPPSAAALLANDPQYRQAQREKLAAWKEEQAARVDAAQLEMKADQQRQWDAAKKQQLEQERKKAAVAAWREQQKQLQKQQQERAAAAELTAKRLLEKRRSRPIVVNERLFPSRKAPDNTVQEINATGLPRPLDMSNRSRRSTGPASDTVVKSYTSAATLCGSSARSGTASTVGDKTDGDKFRATEERQKQREQIQQWRAQQEMRKKHEEENLAARKLKEKLDWKRRAEEKRRALLASRDSAAAQHPEVSTAPPVTPSGNSMYDPAAKQRLAESERKFKELRRRFDKPLPTVSAVSDTGVAEKSERQTLAGSEPVDMATAGESDDGSEGDAPGNAHGKESALSYYKLTGGSKATVRAEFAYDSQIVGELKQGATICVFEVRLNGRGQVRLRFGPDISNSKEEGTSSVEDETCPSAGWVDQHDFPSREPLFEPQLNRNHQRQRNGEYQFREANAWDRRFMQQAEAGTKDGNSKDETFDEWYISYQQSRELREYCQTKIGSPESLILHIGCGNSRMAPGLHDDGYKLIANVDLSAAVVAQMRSKYAESHPDLLFMVGDGLALGESPGFDDETFDVVVDKGTLQSLLLLRGGMAKAAAFARQVWNVLKPGGRLIEIMGSSGMQQYIQPPDLPWASVTFKKIKRVGIGGYAVAFTLTKPNTTVEVAADEPSSTDLRSSVTSPQTSASLAASNAAAPWTNAAVSSTKENTAAPARESLWQRLLPATPAVRAAATTEVQRMLAAAPATAQFGCTFEELFRNAAAAASSVARGPTLPDGTRAGPLSRTQLTQVLRDDPSIGFDRRIGKFQLVHLR